MEPSHTTHHAVISSELGPITLIVRNENLVGVYFAQHKNRPLAESKATLGSLIEPSQHTTLALAAEQLTQYLAGELREFSLPIHLEGSEFALHTWALLQDIPYGSTTTYGELASKLGNRHFAQRVGQVVGANPLSIIVPCHRVVGADGSLTGYAGGLERKRHLLNLEGALPEALF
ncbi:methylated-DNA--[protein]-cysteine S-methyltransferase [Corynebacterium sp. 153RC1]|uniref:methylated-DNA--[protein]-cysteine S-methyltransferase n=1 Tax=unclassified Corynebacterium TaxID=2624378 RepID=UPI00211CE1D7|nr:MULTISPECIES: methylated-DNA--[protein]-cysteine S-methyltransferase [unclassified Corynebacterium]MCQ9352748.1 methylated-DNA--[protein]-cysteine S-methyltransferase [Corynebacterium sp. 209RC1]MCQ9354932.1 methylated-DNA--[protein]-cysteine S-methyltransferase [Corynebacterium sp. 1222RC1]MCQ9357193.1 methylated-DNA--[protein]-cysteine S-methyltransferase [Corynebacterium sp. 122RC1]MCQ9359368.1 methylated-DNA--[protein]-cysteine S-methyltransferase [Corynebacterium sp. 142RC1]MCQ9361590.